VCVCVCVRVCVCTGGGWWPPVMGDLVGPAPHAILSVKEAASIFRAIMREPVQEQAQERAEAAAAATENAEVCIRAKRDLK
jgi:predicted methyltransferase